MSERVTRHDADGLCTLTLNRPDKLNALDTPAFEALDAHLAALEGQPNNIGCVVAGVASVPGLISMPWARSRCRRPSSPA
jgi:enoyl-CoA hydratase/carnithine racemase